MNAVIKAGGKQYYVTEGSEIFVEKIEANEGDKVEFHQVLMLDSKVILILLELLFKEKFLRMVSLRKLKFSNIRVKIDQTVLLKVIDNLTLKSRLLKLMVNYD